MACDSRKPNTSFGEKIFASFKLLRQEFFLRVEFFEVTDAFSEFVVLLSVCFFFGGHVAPWLTKNQIIILL